MTLRTFSCSVLTCVAVCLFSESGKQLQGTLWPPCYGEHSHAKNQRQNMKDHFLDRKYAVIYFKSAEQAS